MPGRAGAGLAGVLLASLLLVGATATPAFAHATLISVDPQPESVLDAAPTQISLRFDQKVDVALGGFRVYDGKGEPVDVSEPRHPAGSPEILRVELPELENGTYIVTWRAISADAHPIAASFTFQVGPRPTAADPASLADRLLATHRGSTTVGALYAAARWLAFGALAVLIGGAAFVLFLDPVSRGRVVTRRLLVGAWTALTAATVVGIGLEGVYAAALPLTKVVDGDVLGNVLDTRFGRVAVLRLALLALAAVWYRAVWRRSEGRSPDGAVTSPLVLAGAVVLGVALAVTPGLAGHAATGRLTALAVPADVLHVLAMSVWLGGLLFLVVLGLPRAAAAGDAWASGASDAHRAVRRFSNVGLGAVGVLAVTGTFQGWRQVGGLDALRDSDYGRILLVKLGLVAGIVVAAAFSREIVNRWWVADRADPDGDVDAAVDVDVAVGDDGVAARDGRRLRRSVLTEVVLAGVVLVATALLVNAAPPRQSSEGPIAFTMRSRAVWVDVLVTPGVAGPNDIHVTVLDPHGTLTNVLDLQIQVTNVDRDIAPITVAQRRLGPGHYLVPAFDLPYPGTWRITAKALTSETDLTTLSRDFEVR